MPKPYHKNPRQITGKQREQLKDWLLELGDLAGIVHDLNSDEIVGGNQRSAVFDLDDCTIELTEQHAEPDKQGTVAHGFVVWRGNRYAYRQVRWTERQCEKANIVANRAGGAWDFDVLANEFDIDDLFSWGFEPIDFGLDEPEEDDDPQDAAPQIDRAEQLREEWGVELGQMWRLPARDGSGEHRIVCGDCTDADVVARVMGGDVADLVFADPPYGMGKENDGIANDNLYRENLDAFQMEWWRACRPHIKSNGSAYIWGTAGDLWRLWYLGGLRDSERLTMRNEIVWDKGSGQGMASGVHRMYPTITERAIFFMLGEQGFNNNADNYWEGWEPIRSYLDGERIACGWSKPDVESILGSVNKSQHILVIVISI